MKFVKWLQLFAIISVIIFASSNLLLAQTAPDLENGFKHYGSYDGSHLDTVNLMNGNLMLHAPLLPGYPQRGKFSVQDMLSFNAKTWQVVCVDRTFDTGTVTQCGWYPGANGVTLQRSVDLAMQRTIDVFFSGTGSSYSASGYSLTTTDGALHQLYATATANGVNTEFETVDNTGYHVVLSGADGSGVRNTATVTDRQGNQYVVLFDAPANCGALPYNPPLPNARIGGGYAAPMIDDVPRGDQFCPQFAFATQVTDSNGNVLNLYNPQSSQTQGIDTLGRPLPLESGITQTTDYRDCVSPIPIVSAWLMNYTAPDGSTRQMKLCFVSPPFVTAFNQPGVAETGAALSLGPRSPASNGSGAGIGLQPVGTVILADGTKWAFTYDGYQDITSISLPTGGSITYDWTTIGLASGCSGQTKVSRAVKTRKLDDGHGHTSQWTYNWGTPINGVISNVVTDPLFNDTAHIFTALDGPSGCIFYETSTQYYQGLQSAGHLLKQVDTSYYPVVNFVVDSQDVVTGNVVAKDITTTVYPSGKVSKIHREYDQGLGTGKPIFGNVVKEQEFDWGAGAPGPLLRETDTVYKWQKDSAYLAAHMLDLPASVVVISPNSASNTKSACPINAAGGTASCMVETDYSYDEPGYLTTPTPAISTQHVAPPNGVRGNQTTVSRWLNTSNNFVPSHTNWLDTGEVYQQVDPLGHTTTHSYDPFYAGAYATQTCSASTGSVAHCASGTYDFNTGVLTSLTNENATTRASGNTFGDSAHTSNYTYDYMFRITSAQAPPDPANGSLRAQTSFNFSAPNAFPLSVQRAKSITSSLTDSATSFFDGLGRSYQSQHVLPGGTSTVDTTLDFAGRPSIVSNPYFTTSDPTYGTTTTQFDGLDRAYSVTKQDGSISSVAYSVQTTIAVNGDCVQTTDEADKLSRACTDGMGRLVEVDEPGGPDPGVPATASVTISGAFNHTWVSPGSPHLAAIGTALASLATSDGSSHDFYFDTNQHLCQMSWISGSGWFDQDLTSMTESGLPVAGSSIAAVALGGVIHVFYQGANQHIYDMNWTGSIWQNLDMTVITSASAISNTKMAIVATGSSNTPMMFYEGSNQHLFGIYWNASTSTWQNADLHSLSGATNLIAPNGAISAAMWGTTGNIHALFLDTNQNLNRIVWSGTAWITNNLTSITGAALAVPGSKLTTIPTGTSIDLMTFYEGAGQHIYSIYWNNSAGTYQTLDFTVWSGATNIAAVLTSLANNPVGPHMFYLSTNQHLYDMLWNGSAWVNADLTSLANTTAVPASGSSLSSHGTSGGNTYNIFFAGGNQHIYHTYFSPSASAWFNEDPLVAASNFVVDSGTVSLTIPNGGSSFTATVCYGVSTNPICAGQPVNASPGAIANALAAVLNGAGSPVNATLTGATLSLTWRTTGVVTTTVAPMTSTSDNPALFANGSFTSTSGTFSGGIAASNQSLRNPFITQYSYDALGNLLRVDQKGSAPSDSTQWRTRTFTYDSLSRLLTANNPESGTITYSYDADSELLQKTSPAPNQTGTATQTVSYCYDELHRVTGKGYGAQSCPLATPVVTYAYDSGTNAIGHLTSLTDQAGTASYSYDILGRLTAETRTLTGANNASISKNLSYDYNLDGSLYKLHYPSGNVVTYEPGVAGLTLSAKDTGNNINYVTSATYGPDSGLTGFISGYSTSFAGITKAFTFNKRLQPINMSASAPSQTVFSIGYDFHSGTGTAGSGTDNGNVYGITNYKDTTRSQTFTYDALNRLASAQNAGTDCTVNVLNGNKKFWGNNYSYDAWGNLLNKTKIGTACAGENLSLTADAHNWIHATGGSDYQYDAAGNMTFNATPPTQAYTYDQENRLTGAAGYAYTYDADGNRVRKSNSSTGTLYWYMTPGIVGESDLSGNLTDEYVFFDGERVARKSTNGVFYYFSDHLKTSSVITDASGNIKSESDFYPWGGELQFVANDSNHYKFTGKERDGETQLDYFGARFYSNGLGRWVSADWSPTPIPVPYADFYDPQTLNLYQFVGGNPASKADPDGHACPPVCTLPTPTAEDWKMFKAAVPLLVRAGLALKPVAVAGAPAVLALPSIGAMALVATQPPVQNTPDGSPNLILDALNPSYQPAPPVPQTAAGGNGAKDGGNNTTTAVSPGPDGMKKGSSNPDGAGKPFSEATKNQARAESGDKCVFCGKNTTREPGPDQSNIDHADPRSRGGDNSLDNAQNTCRTCNQEKGTKTTDEYLHDRQNNPK